MFFSGIADEAGPDIDTQIRAHQALGWKHIELRNIDKMGVNDICDRVFDEVVGKLADAGIAISSFASQLCNWARPIVMHPGIDQAELSRAMPRMRRTGCPFIRIMSYPNRGWSEDDWRDEVVARLKVLAEMAEDGGVTLLHENCNGWGGEGPEHTLQLLELVDSPAMKLVWDTGNPVAHDQNAWEYYSAVKEHVVYVHIKDARRVDGKTQFTYCGEGDGAVEDTLRDLISRGYEGGFSIEPHLAAIVHEGKAASEADLAFEKYVEYGKRLMAIVEKVS